MVWSTSCAALEGRFFEVLEMHCKGWKNENREKCIVRVPNFEKGRVLAPERAEIFEKRVENLRRNAL